MFQHNTRKLALTCILCLVPMLLLAHTTKSAAPYYFVADSVTYLSKAHSITYTGHVKVDQGQTHITGDQLSLYLTTTNKIIKMIDRGHPATYITQLPKKPGLVHARATRITYDQLNQMVYLDGNAVVEQNHNTIRAPHIRYDKKRGIIHTNGSKNHMATHITVMPTHQRGVRHPAE